MDIYAEVTDRIIAQLEAGTVPWCKPWMGAADEAVSHTTGKPYSLINQMLLGKPGEYLTFNQCKKEGGRIKKGAKSKIIVFWKMIHSEVADANGTVKKDSNGEAVMKLIPVLKYFNVFHIDDCEGIEAKHKPEELPMVANPVERAEGIVADYAQRAKLVIEHAKQDRAYYSPTFHKVSLPLMEQFVSTEEYYSTKFHELTHSTGHESLLDRFSANAASAAFGGEEYSKEELGAEIGACGILCELGMESSSSFRNSASYIQAWIKRLKDDKRMIVSAASRAEKAIRLILGVDDAVVEV